MHALANTSPGLIRFYQKVSTKLFAFHLLIFTVGIAWLCLLPLEDYNGRCYISENALLVGMIELKFGQDFHQAKHYISHHTGSTAHQIASLYFNELQFETAQQNFSIHLPSILVQSGINTYGMFHAERSCHTEILVVHTSMDDKRVSRSEDIANFALFLGLASYYSRQNYWARDILFLMTSHDSIGVQAWLQQFLGKSENSNILKSQSLQFHPGNILGMVSIKIQSEIFNLVRIKTEGVNGMLPNLDLVNTISIVAWRSLGIPTNFKPLRYLNYKELLYNTLYMAWNQVLGIPTGPHGPFLHYGIQGLTLEAVRDRTYNTREFSPTELGNLVESYMRSLNNLLETLHQSFNFYLLPGNDRYISIGIYIPPLMCILAPLLLKAIVLWIGYLYPWISDSGKVLSDKKEVSFLLLHSKPIPLQPIATILLAYSFVALLTVVHKYLYLYPGFPFSIVLLLCLLTFRSLTVVTRESAPFFHSLLIILLSMSTVAISILNFPIAFIISLLLTICVLLPRVIPILLPVLILAPSIAWIFPQLSFIANIYTEYEAGQRIFEGWGYSAIFLIIVPLFIYKDPS